ncbi:DUF4062 domain-containing protein [Cohnella faecalis]|uniref:DUF4062 domain-containing protein n=1 Tax=Cohnella faecalis TaxID=2315694 RepID=A0A398CUP6_9BACL|nr:DUF4062 domain-containing protein [Cohnella faecalis]RIE03011.1 DUF4062 domain-containing protein [Cohnella faecalis]
MTNFAASTYHQPRSVRSIRVFISSTFLDMSEERDELVQKVFPELRSLCAKRGVVWSEVDLRWGIREEQVDKGLVLPLCLKEIDNCQPFFIGMLGERYGSISRHEIPQELLRDYPEIEPYLGRSITEIEIRHALQRPQESSHSYFYFRDPSFVTRTREDKRHLYEERISPREELTLGKAQAESLAAERKALLEGLKQDIRSSGAQCREGFADSRQLGQWVLEDFTKLIDRLYPQDRPADAAERERYEHEIHAMNTTGDVYIRNKDYFEGLNDRVLTQRRSALVHGISGSGKSSLLSHWIKSVEASEPDIHVVKHYVGLTKTSASCIGTVQRLIGELNARFDMNVPVPLDVKDLRDAFFQCLRAVPETETTIVMIDAINQFEDADDHEFFSWLPTELGSHIRFVLSSTRSGPEELEDWESMEVGLLGEEDKRHLLGQFLSVRYGKELEPRHIEQIVAAPQTENPLYLRALLEEIRLIGDRGSFDKQLGDYLLAPTPDLLYDQILARYERVYGDGSGRQLVKEALSLIGVSRSGLLEQELRDLLGKEGEQLSSSFWSPFMVAVEPYLTNRSAPLRIYHTYMKQAIERRYLNESASAAARRKIARYFDSDPRATDMERKLDELPWQLIRLKEWGRLKELYKNHDFLLAAWKNDPYDVKIHLTTLENETVSWKKAGTPIRLTEMYSDVFNRPETYPLTLISLLAQWMEARSPDPALKLNVFLENVYRETGNTRMLQQSLYRQAEILRNRGRIEKAAVKVAAQLELCRDNGHLDGLQAGHGLMADILIQKGQYPGAEKHLGELERLLAAMPTFEGRRLYLSKQAKLNRMRFRLDEADEQLSELRSLCIAAGNKDALQECLGEQMLLLKEKGACGIPGALEEALALVEERKQICDQFGNQYGLMVSLAYESDIYCKLGDFNKAKYSEKHQKALNREFRSRHVEQLICGVQARVEFYGAGKIKKEKKGTHYNQMKSNIALALLKDKETICKELGLFEELQDAYDMQGEVLYRGFGTQYVKEAIKKRELQEGICRDIGYTMGLQRSLHGKGHVYLSISDFDSAMKAFGEQLALLRPFQLPHYKQTALGSMARARIGLYSVKKDRELLHRALEDLQEQESLTRDIANEGGILFSIDLQAETYRHLGDRTNALQTMERYILAAEQFGREEEKLKGEKKRQKWTTEFTAGESAEKSANEAAPASEGATLTEPELAMLAKIGGAGASRERHLFDLSQPLPISQKIMTRLHAIGFVVRERIIYDSRKCNIYRLSEKGAAYYEMAFGQAPVPAELDGLQGSPFGMEQAFFEAELFDSLARVGGSAGSPRGLVPIEIEGGKSWLYVHRHGRRDEEALALFEEAHGFDGNRSFYLAADDEELLYGTVMPLFYRWLLRKYEHWSLIEGEYIVHFVPPAFVLSFSQDMRPHTVKVSAAKLKEV